VRYSAQPFFLSQLFELRSWRSNTAPPREEPEAVIVSIGPRESAAVLLKIHYFATMRPDSFALTGQFRWRRTPAPTGTSVMPQRERPCQPLAGGCQLRM